MTTQLHYDIVGSFLRPQALKEAREQFAAGQLSQADLTKVEDAQIKELVQKEAAAGLKVVTDGEFRRSYWHLDTFWGFGGIEYTTQTHGYFFHDEETRNDSAQVAGKIRFTGAHPDLTAFKYLKSLTDGTDLVPRQSIPSPAQCYAELYRGDENIAKLKEVYANEDDLITDLATAYRDLILALYDAGFDREQLAAKYLEVNNGALVDLPADLRVSTHICRGNYHSTWAAKGGYGPVAKYVFAKENVSAFYLEFDDERSGGFEPLQEVPAGKEVVLGLVTSKKPELEAAADLVARIKEASQYVSLDDLALSTQCGFASTEEGNQLTEDQQWAKIKLVVEVAKQVWG